MALKKIEKKIVYFHEKNVPKKIGKMKKEKWFGIKYSILQMTETIKRKEILTVMIWISTFKSTSLKYADTNMKI